MTEAPPHPRHKLLQAHALDAAGWRRPLVFTNGVFDLLHAGHVDNLVLARGLGASLLVAVNSDVSARRLGKGPGRPVNCEADRVLVVAALGHVDHVVLFDEATPCALLQRLRPDFYVKGGDYDIETLPETALMRSWGGRALALPLLPGRSSTGMLARLRGQDRGD